jgi:hypothetical protein
VDWLQDELNLRYDVPRAIAQEWVASDQIIPLLDGLDEVRADQRAACVEAINAYRQSHGLLPMAITSRIADYDSLAKPLRLQGAILVQPLTREQVDAYLINLGPAGENVRAALREDSSLWEMLDSPLLLNVVTVAYAGREETPSPVHGTSADRRDRLFDTYVNTTLRRRATEQQYPPEQTIRWLSWLASEMARHGQTVFYLERLQRDWLPESQRQAVSVWERLFVGLFVGLFAGLVVGLVAGRYSGLVSGLVVGLALGLVSGLVGGLAPGLKAGGGAFLKHLLLRILLVRNGSIPWNYVGFLDFAAERVLLRKIGGGYAFLHRILLEHFAARYVKEEPRRSLGVGPGRSLGVGPQEPRRQS